MKPKYFLLIITLGLFTNWKNNAKKTAIRIVIDSRTTKKILEGMIEALKSADIILRIDESVYNENGILEKIKGEVDFPNHGHASFHSEKVGRIFITQDLNVKNGGFSVEVHKRWF